MNRPVRTRTPGGVGRAGEKPALTRLALFEVLKRFAICIFPSGKAISSPSMNYSGRSTRTVKLSVLCEDEETILFDERSVLNEFLAKCDDIWVL